MLFLTQGKTNWKFLLIVVVFAAVISGGILWFASEQEIPQPSGVITSVESSFISPQRGEQWKIGESHTIEIKQPIDESQPFTHLTLNKPNGEEIGVIYCKIGGTGKTTFTWETKSVLNYCGAGLENKTKEIEPGDYVIVITKDVEGRPISARSEQFLIVVNETADWQTYRNEEYGFEIKYPKNWNYGPNILKTEPNIVFCPPEFSDPDPSLKCQWKSENGHMPDSLAPIYLFVSKKPGGTFTLDNLSMQECEESEKRTINNILMKISQCEERGQEVIWYGPGNVYIFRLFLKDSLFSDTFDQILFTFRFLGTEDETVDWQAYRNEEYGFEFEYPQEWGNITLNSKENNDVYVLESSNEKTDKVFYFKSQNVIIFIEKRELQISCDWEGLFYEQILKILYPDKSMSVIYTTKTPQNCFQLETIGKVNISPDAKYVSFIISGYEWSNSMIINRETGVNILENSSIEFGNPYEDIYWLNENKILVIKSYTNEAYGGGESGLFVSEYNNLEKLYDILPLNFGEYICGSYFYNIYFSGDNKLFFSLSLKETEKQTCSEEKIKKYEYNIDTKELKEI